MPVTTITIKHPTGTPSISLDASNLTLNNPNEQWATASFSIDRSYSSFETENATTNPLQTNSYVVITRGSQAMFHGSVESITRDVSNEQMINVSCASVEYRLNRSLALVSGETSAASRAPVIDLAAVVILPLSTTTGFDAGNEYAYYPTFDKHENHSATSPWYGWANCPTTTLAAGMTSGATTCTLTDGNAFHAPGFILIDNELIYADNLYKDSSGNWKMHLGDRGVLGTSNASHSNGANVYMMRVKPISMEQPMTVTVDPTTTRIPPSEYVVRPSDGRIDFTIDPGGYANVQLTASWLDMDDDVNGLQLGNIISTMAQETGFGPGLAGAEIDVTALATVYLESFNLSGPAYFFDVVKQLIDENWHRGKTPSDRMIVTWSPSDGKLVAKSITQSATADVVFAHASEIMSTVSLQQLHTAALVTYRYAQQMPLLAYDRCWHPARGQDPATAPNSGSVTDNWDAYLFQDLDRSYSDGWQANTSGIQHNIYTNRLFDGDVNTGWGIRNVHSYWQTGDPWITVLFAWFPGSDTFVLDSAGFTADLRNIVGGFYHIRMVGYSTYTPGTPPTLGTVIPLGIESKINDDYIPFDRQVVDRAYKISGRPGYWFHQEWYK